MNNLKRFVPLISLLGAIVIAGVLAFISPDFMTTSQKWLTFALLLFGYLLYEYRLEPVQTGAATGARTSAPVQGAVQTGANPSAPVQGAVQRPVQTFVAPVQRPVQPPVQVVTRPDPPVEALSLTFYQKEAIVINRQLAEVYKLALAIDFRDKNAIVLTPTKVVYRTTQTGPVTLTKVERIAEDLARDISTLYRQKALGANQTQRVSVQVADPHPIVFQVTRAQPKNLEWEKRPSLPAFQTCCGFYLDGWTMRPMVLDIERKDSQHGFGAWIGQQRSGKSRSMEAALNQLLANTPTSLELYGIDLNADLFAQYVGVPQLKSMARTMEEALPILAMFAKWCSAEYAPTDGIVRLLVIDELQKLINHPELGVQALKYIKTIMQEGGKYLLRLWCATQNPSEENYPAALKPLTQFMLCSRIQNDYYVRQVLQLQGAGDLLPKVEQLYDGPEGSMTLATFWYDDDQVAASLAELRTAQPGAATQPNLVATAPADVKFPIPPNRAPTKAEWREVQHRIAAGEFRHRGELSLTQLCIFVYGSKNEDKANFIKAMLSESEDEDEE